MRCQATPRCACSSAGRSRRGPPRDFEARRRAAVRGLTDQVGPLAETLAIKIERARTADELRPLLATAVQVIGNARGRGAAADYAARFADLEPPPEPGCAEPAPRACVLAPRHGLLRQAVEDQVE